MLVALFAPWLAPYDPIASDVAHALAPPDAAHWAGTDQLGRDIFSRIVAATPAGSVHRALGRQPVLRAWARWWAAFCGYRGGRLDRWVGRFVDVLMAFPLFVLAMALVAALGNRMENIIIATAVINLPFYIRFARAEVNVRRNAGWVEAARACGDGQLAVVLRFLLPNVLPAMAVQISLNLGWAILNAAGLSFIGLGVQAADARMGHHGRRGRALHHHRQVVAGGVPWPGADADGAVLQPAGRRAAGHARSADAHVSGALLLASRTCASASPPGTGRSTALHGIGFALDAGQTLGIVGESGSGKSVTSLAVMRLLDRAGRIDRGAVLFQGPRHHPRAARRPASLRGAAMSMIFQNPRSALNPIRTVEQQIVDVLRAHHAPRAAAPGARRWSCCRPC